MSVPSQPATLNYLPNNSFTFGLNKFPTVGYFCQNVNLPNLSLGEAGNAEDTPFTRIPVPGDRLVFGELQLTFLVDEDMANYTELYNWLVQTGFPVEFGQYRVSSTPVDEIYSDGTLLIRNSKSNVIKTVTFQDLYPTSLSDLQFDANNTGIDYMVCVAAFRYRMFSLT